MNFNKQQRARLELEEEVKFWAKRYNQIEHPNLKTIADIKIRNLITGHCEYDGLRKYHMDRYERLKG